MRRRGEDEFLTQQRLSDEALLAGGQRQDHQRQIEIPIVEGADQVARTPFAQLQGDARIAATEICEDGRQQPGAQARGRTEPYPAAA